MPMPYLLMAVLFAGLAVLAAAGASLISLQLQPWFQGVRWLRVHLINIGLFTEVAFGILPALVSARAGRPRPPFRWSIWLLLNAGLIVLLIGIPLINATLIIAGGTLIFIASALLIKQLGEARGPKRQPAPATAQTGRAFYIAGLSYLLLGIFLGVGLWLGWGQALGLSNPKEVHVHANLWGFVSLTFAGLLFDTYPSFAGRAPAWPRSSTAIFWMMTLGALGLVAGPWLEASLLSTLGLILHTGGTLWLLANIVKPLIGDRRAWTAGMLHLVTGYVWLLAPTIVAPLMVLNAPGFPVAEVESNGGPILVYGWMLQFGYAMLPYLFARALLPDEPARLGGNRFSLMATHAGGVFYWLGLFVVEAQPILHGVAFGVWALSLLPIVAGLWRTLRRALDGRAGDGLRVAGGG